MRGPLREMVLRSDPSPNLNSLICLRCPLPRGESVSCVSSGLPWTVVSENGVEDGEELSSDGDESDHLRPTGGDEAIEEGLQHGIVLFGHHCAHEQGGPHGLPAAADEAFAAPLAGLARERGEPCQGGDLPAAAASELGQFGNQRAAMMGPTPGTDLSKSCFSRQTGEPRTASSMSVLRPASSFSSALIRRAILLRRCGPSCASHAGARRRSSRRSAAGGQPDQPTAASLRRARAAPAACRLGEVGDDSGIDGIGLGTLPDRLGEGPHLGRIDDDHRKACCRQRRNN